MVPRTMPAHSPSAVISVAIPGLAALLSGLFVFGVACAERLRGARAPRALLRAGISGLGVLAWAALALALAHSGLLARFDARPPPFMVLLALTFALCLLLAFSRFGERLALDLPLWALVGFQAFRLPLELVLHRAVEDGVLPVEMSYAGYNFDILSGISALLLGIALWNGRAGARAVRIWNLLGFLLLANIVTIAVLATPRFHAFGPTHLNTLVAEPPFVLLPTILVQAALLGHILVFRRLRVLTRLNESSGTGSTDPHHPDTAPVKG
jgi:hypothetical protein